MNSTTTIHTDPELRITGESDPCKTAFQNGNQTGFVARAIHSLEAAAKTQSYVDADVVLEKLQQRLAAAKVKRTEVTTK